MLNDDDDGGGGGDAVFVCMRCMAKRFWGGSCVAAKRINIDEKMLRKIPTLGLASVCVCVCVCVPTLFCSLYLSLSLAHSPSV